MAPSESSSNAAGAAAVAVEGLGLVRGQVVTAGRVRGQDGKPHDTLRRRPPLELRHHAALVLGADERARRAGPLQHDCLALELGQPPLLHAAIQNVELWRRLADLRKQSHAMEAAQHACGDDEKVTPVHRW